jgi:uncharacterized protein involved in outer membrane biogenesis
MKKFIIRLAIALVIVVILAIVAAGMFMDRAIKAGVEAVGSTVTGVDVKLDSVSLSLLSGAGGFKGFVLGNPAGCKTPWAINVGAASLALEPRSLLSDKVVIKSINIEAPQIVYETDLRQSNLRKILANVEAFASSGQTAPAKPGEGAQPKGTKASKKFQVNDFVLKGAKIRVSVTAMGEQSATVPLPEIHLQDLGTGPDGITAVELTQKILGTIEKETALASASTVADIGKGAVYMAKDLAKNPTNALEKVSKGLGLGDLIKKK